MASLIAAARSVLSPLAEVTQLASLRRSTSLYSQGQAADSLYVVDEGMVKLTRSNSSNGKILLGIFGPGQVVGEESLLDDPAAAYYADAEVLTTSVVFRVPRAVIGGLLLANAEFAAALGAAIIRQKISLAEKVELLCLHDVEYRILHYLAALSTLVPPDPDGDGYQLPITQLELADLIGATRETTSTMLNQLERRNLVKLSRRLLTIPSPEALREAASARKTSTNGVAVALSS
ncbi:MAG: cAMP-binding protein [Bryobacterales bacterium]|nr:cAMP-binding protein [Bryobacterales bacterium]